VAATAAATEKSIGMKPCLTLGETSAKGRASSGTDFQPAQFLNKNSPKKTGKMPVPLPFPRHLRVPRATKSFEHDNEADEEENQKLHLTNLHLLPTVR
jgi:hypothetical protein